MSKIQPAGVSASFNQRESEILSLISAGLTNLEIAHSLFISLDTVKWYNQRIFGKLGVNNRTQAIQKAREIRLINDQPALVSIKTILPRHNLPAAVDSFIGRQEEMSRLQNLLYAHRLITLAGPGGVGKTRLAIQVGWALEGAFTDGIFLVSLAGTREPDLVPNAIAASLHLHEVPGRPVVDLLQEHLAEKDLLLILDNFEQVLEAGPQVHLLLAGAPYLQGPGHQPRNSASQRRTDLHPSAAAHRSPSWTWWLAILSGAALWAARQGCEK